MFDLNFLNNLNGILKINYEILILLKYSEQDWKLFPAPAPALNCLCPAGQTSWSVFLLLNRTSPNILPVCKVTFLGSLHPLGNRQAPGVKYIKHPSPKS